MKQQLVPYRRGHKLESLDQFETGLPISPFFRGILDFYHINLTHLNPNSILQISIFVHLCEAYLGVLPHFGLWKYLYHCRPGMAGGQHQLVGGASLEMRRGRKTEYLEVLCNTAVTSAPASAPIIGFLVRNPRIFFIRSPAAF